MNCSLVKKSLAEQGSQSKIYLMQFKLSLVVASLEDVADYARERMSVWPRAEAWSCFQSFIVIRLANMFCQKVSAWGPRFGVTA